MSSSWESSRDLALVLRPALGQAALVSYLTLLAVLHLFSYSFKKPKVFQNCWLHYESASFGFKYFLVIIILSFLSIIQIWTRAIFSVFWVVSLILYSKYYTTYLSVQWKVGWIKQFYLVKKITFSTAPPLADDHGIVQSNITLKSLLFTVS